MRQCYWDEECQEDAKDQCPWCDQWFCYNHVVLVAIYKKDYAEDAYVCPPCLSTKYEELERQLAIAQEDAYGEPAQALRALQAQIRRCGLEKEALRRQLQKLGVKPCC